MGHLHVIGQFLSLVCFKAGERIIESLQVTHLFPVPAPSNSALKPESRLIGVDAPLVDVELLVSDEVHVALGTPIEVLLWGEVSFPHVSLSVLQGEEREVAIDALGLGVPGLAVPHHLALPALDVPGEVGQVVPAGPAVLTHVRPLLGLTLGRGCKQGVRHNTNIRQVFFLFSRE